jgi:hypothetical protein
LIPEAHVIRIDFLAQLLAGCQGTEIIEGVYSLIRSLVIIGDGPAIKFVQDHVSSLIESVERADGRMKEELQVILFFILLNASPIPNDMFCHLLSNFPLISFPSGTNAVYTALTNYSSVETLSEETAKGMVCALGRLFAMCSSEMRKLKLNDEIVFRMSIMLIVLLRRFPFEVMCQDLAGNELKKRRIRTVIERAESHLRTAGEGLFASW